jgi:hypothetical protein
LAPRREYLLDRLSRKLPRTERFSADVREWIVDASIEYAALHYKGKPIRSRAELERVFWNAADRRVKQAAEGRREIVRGKNYRRVDLSVLDDLTVTETPEDEVLALAEATSALQFAALLSPGERDVWSCQLHAGGSEPPGARRIAQQLGMPIAAVLKAERSINAKLDRYAVIYTAGRMCGYLAPAIADLAAGHDDPQPADHPRAEGRALAALVHLRLVRCKSCRADYKRHVRYLRGARFHNKVAALLPAPEVAEQARRGALRELVPDWIARALAHEPTGTATQLVAGGAGRGLTTSAAAHLAAFCIGSAGTLGACIATGVLPPPRQSVPPVVERVTATPTPTPKARSRPREREAPLPHGVATATPTPTPKPKRARRAGTSAAERSPAKTQGGTGPSSHEKRPATPAPANAAPNGASEFDPTYKPSAPPAPAPVPAAPGASEFF